MYIIGIVLLVILAILIVLFLKKVIKILRKEILIEANEPAQKYSSREKTIIEARIVTTNEGEDI